MIDKSWKLQRYDRKDYTELVEFPVEIVGRDGVVRRYTFEDSIRLYQRRITFAPIRFRDGDLVRAEVGHCRARIGQLRRSYFHRYGWGTPEGEAGAEQLFDELAGELAAFLCRVLRVDGRPELHFKPVKDLDGVSTWFVTPQGAIGMLLYVHRFDGPGADRVREGFFAQLKELEGICNKDEGDVERLLAFHHTVDCGFILAGRGNELDEVTLGASDVPLQDLSPTPFDEVLELVRRGELESSLGRCKRLVSEQPWHLNAYSLGAVLALHVDDVHSAEDLGAIGGKYFAEDGLLRWCLGVARLRQGRTSEAEADLAEAIRLAPEQLGPRISLITHLLRSDRLLEARVAMEAVGGLADGEDVEQAEQVRTTARVLSQAIPGIALGATIAAAGGVAMAGIGVPGLALVCGGVVIAGAAWMRAQHHKSQLMSAPDIEDLAVTVKRVQRRLRNDPRIS